MRCIASPPLSVPWSSQYRRLQCAGPPRSLRRSPLHSSGAGVTGAEFSNGDQAHCGFASMVPRLRQILLVLLRGSFRNHRPPMTLAASTFSTRQASCSSSVNWYGVILLCECLMPQQHRAKWTTIDQVTQRTSSRLIRPTDRAPQSSGQDSEYAIPGPDRRDPGRKNFARGFEQFLL